MVRCSAAHVAVFFCYLLVRHGPNRATPNTVAVASSSTDPNARRAHPLIQEGGRTSFYLVGPISIPISSGVDPPFQKEK